MVDIRRHIHDIWSEQLYESISKGEHGHDTVPVPSGHVIEVVVFLKSTDGKGVSPVNYYRALQPVRQLGLSDSRFDVSIMTQDDVKVLIEGRHAEVLLGKDIYVVSRLYTNTGLEGFLDVIRSSGGKVVFDTDDDLTCDHRELGRGDEFKKMVGLVDLVTTSTPHLSKKLESYTGYKPPVLYNHIDFNWFSRVSIETEKKVDNLTIGLIGTASHEGDWGYPVEALKRIASEFPNVTIVVAGYMPPYLKDIENVVWLEPVLYESYPRLMRQFDIVCCSLDPDDEFNKSKSAIKSLEAMSAARVLSNGKVGGAVPVCTTMPVYRRAVSKNNGILTDNARWYESIKSLVEDEQLRNKLAVQGYKWVKKNRDIKTGYKAWGKVYRNLVGGKYDNISSNSRSN